MKIFVIIIAMVLCAVWGVLIGERLGDGWYPIILALSGTVVIIGITIAILENLP